MRKLIRIDDFRGFKVFSENPPGGRIAETELRPEDRMLVEIQPDGLLIAFTRDTGNLLLGKHLNDSLVNKTFLMSDSRPLDIDSKEVQEEIVEIKSLLSDLQLQEYSRKRDGEKLSVLFILE